MNRISLAVGILGIAAMSLAGEKIELHGAARKSAARGQFLCLATVLDSSSGEVLLQKELLAGPEEPAQAVNGTSDRSRSGTEDRFSCTISKDQTSAEIRYVKTTFVSGKPSTVSDYETQVPIK
jgi:hypothetical protein